MNAKQFAAARKGIMEHFGKDVAEGKESKEYLAAIAPLAKYAKMDKSRITASIVGDWIAANPDWKKATKKTEQPANPDHAVFQDAERRTCIRISVDRKYIRFIPMATILSVEKMTHMDFEKRYTMQLKDYPVKQAAQMYLGANWLEVSPEAKRHLEFLISGKFKEAVKPLNFEDKESIMATKPATKPAAGKTKVAAPKPAAKAAKVAAPAKAAKEPKAPAGPDNRKITVLVAENPKRGGAAERFDLYKKNNTVEKYVAAGGKREDIAWDVKKGFISAE